jgi:23S rRNA pseudouridine2457 synthase
MNNYYILYKPYDMLSQFTKEGNHQTLTDLGFSFPKDAYPVGRLDADSEGLLLLTNNKNLNHRLLNPSFRHNRTYLIQVEGAITAESCKIIESGVSISVNGEKYHTEKCTVEIVSEPTSLPDRIPPVRFRKSIPTSWIKMTLTEGKNRQVRKMTAAVGFPTLRLIRMAMEDLVLDEMKPGEVKEMKEVNIFKLLKLRP